MKLMENVMNSYSKYMKFKYGFKKRKGYYVDIYV